MKELNRFKSLVAVGLAIALTAPVIGNTATSGFTEQETAVRVSYSDLDLSSNAGVKALYTRLKAASEEACGPTNYRDAGTLQKLARNKACYNQTLNKAVSKVDNDRLTRLHQS